MTSSDLSTLQSLLARFEAFSHLDSEHLEWLASRSRPFHCTIGQELLVADRLPEYCFCIVDGRGRLLHQDPGRRWSPGYCAPGDLVGWAGLVRRSPCEWVTEASPLRLIGFSRDDFYTLERSRSVSKWLAHTKLS